MKELIKIYDEIYGNNIYDVIDTDEVDDIEDAAAALAYDGLYYTLGYFHELSEDEFDNRWDFNLYSLDSDKTTEELARLLRQLGVQKFMEEYGA
jgi:hypothetical protein